MDELWDIVKLSRYLSMKRSTLYTMIERKEIPHYRIGKLARFKPAEIDEWLLTKKCQGESGREIRRARRWGSSPSAASQIVRVPLTS